MLTDDYRLSDILSHLDPAACTYQEWVDVGMAIEQAGESWRLWDDWSRRDAKRYRDGECERKFRSFGRRDRSVTVGTVIHLAMEKGWKPAGENRAFGWDDEVEYKAFDPRWIMPEDVPGPQQPWNPAQEITRYLSLLFNADEYVGYSIETFKTDDGFKPTKGCYTRTAGELMERLAQHPDDIGAAIGDTNEMAGGWIRFNPLDGQGVSDRNVTAFRYALIESDTMPIDKQYATIQALRLPVRVLVHSGKKSLHAIVRVDADSYDEYRKRVDELYRVCEGAGMQLDRNNRNPSRLSRLPGLMRQGRPQYIVAERMGLPSWDAWKDYIDGINDDLPEIESLADAIENPPPLAEELIGGVLRRGHKLLISGASKAGKSFLLIELCVAIAEGRPWMGHECRRGRVAYLNLELDRPSCLRRFADVYRALGIDARHAGNIDIWNLRGRACPMDKLTPRLIRRMRDKGLDAIVIDPIYKVITGDENTASDMAFFCNQFDRIAAELGCAVIYCHHHSKGAQGAKRAMDRASGSGVFARDPDALIDLIELPVENGIRDEWKGRRIREACRQALDQHCPGWKEGARSEDLASHVGLSALAAARLPKPQAAVLSVRLSQIEREAAGLAAFRLEYTLREFPPAAPTACFFRFPLHVPDEGGELKGARAEGERGTLQDANRRRRERAKQRDEEDAERIEEAIRNANMGGPVTVKLVADYLELSTQATRSKLKKLGFEIDPKSHTVVSQEEGDKTSDGENPPKLA